MRRRSTPGAGLGVLLTLVAAALPAGAAEVALSFRDAPGGAASGFRIERRAAGAKRFEPLALVGPGVVEFVDRSASPDALLCYRVRPLASRQADDWSSEVCARPTQPGAHGAGPSPGPAADESGAARPAPGEGGAGNEPAAAAPEAPRRVRAGGGWLQVLE